MRFGADDPLGIVVEQLFFFHEDIRFFVLVDLLCRYQIHFFVPLEIDLDPCST